MARRMTSGGCPYCFGMQFAHVSEKRPGRVVLKCEGCGKHSVRDSQTGAQYPVLDPSDPDSPPSINAR